MSRREESIPYMLVHSIPWWVSTVFAGAVYVLMRWVAPDVRLDDPMLSNIIKAMPAAAGLMASLFLCFAGLNLFMRFVKWISQSQRGTNSSKKTLHSKA